MINRPTRITVNTASLIDNILTNCYFYVNLTKGIAETSISDHFPIFAFTKSDFSIDRNGKTEFLKRDYSINNRRNFSTALEVANWDFIDNSENPQMMYESVIWTFYEIYDNSFPAILAHNIINVLF